MKKQEEVLWNSPVCSNTGCFEVAAVLEPRHLCAACAQDPKKNGPLFPGDGKR